MSHPPRILILPAAAIIIAALCSWRLLNPPQRTTFNEAPQQKRRAPAFQLYDQASTLVNLDSFLHRHTIVIVFFDGNAGPESDESLMELKQFYPALKKEGIIVLGVSTALPQENRNNSSQAFPFPLLSDAAATDPNSVHRTWGCFVSPPSLDKPAGTKPAVFIIDRLGLVPWGDGFPLPESEARGLAARLLKE